ncbi:hypothetical protein LTSEMIN_1256, partial [Salmonella enterica subsp. enterica serovar Minnesota str. A4-603]
MNDTRKVNAVFVKPTIPANVGYSAYPAYAS